MPLKATALPNPDQRLIEHSDWGAHYRWTKGTALSESACLRRFMSKKARSADNYYFLSAVLISLDLHKLFHSLNLTIIQPPSRLLNLSIKNIGLNKNSAILFTVFFLIHTLFIEHF